MGIVLYVVMTLSISYLSGLYQYSGYVMFVTCHSDLTSVVPTFAGGPQYVNTISADKIQPSVALSFNEFYFITYLINYMPVIVINLSR